LYPVGFVGPGSSSGADVEVYFVLELVPAADLGSFLQEAGRLPFSLDEPLDRSSPAKKSLIDPQVPQELEISSIQKLFRIQPTQARL
jgi:hypothetical protein